MRRRRFMLAASALAAPFAGLPGCGGGGGSDNNPPAPVPPSDVVLTLPKDMYLHLGAPTEWWWHIGTLRAGNRTFGFEINAASFAKDGWASARSCSRAFNGVYEGVANARGTFQFRDVSGTAWNEQAL